LSPRALFLSPRAPFLSPRALFFVAPTPFFCRPEASAEGSPIVKEGISRYARNDKMRLRSKRQKRAVAPTPSYCPPEPPFLSPRGVSRGVFQLSKRRFLATLETTEKGCHLDPLFVAPSHFFCPPERKRGVPRHWRASGKHGGRLSPRAQARGLLMKRRAERSEGCLAIARQDKKGR
jgi:hypothetical protein